MKELKLFEYYSSHRFSETQSNPDPIIPHPIFAFDSIPNLPLYIHPSLRLFSPPTPSPHSTYSIVLPPPPLPSFPLLLLLSLFIRVVSASGPPTLSLSIAMAAELIQLNPGMQVSEWGSPGDPGTSTGWGIPGSYSIPKWYQGPAPTLPYLAGSWYGTTVLYPSGTAGTVPMLQYPPSLQVERWTIIKKLGEGGFGAVYKVLYLRDQRLKTKRSKINLSGVRTGRRVRVQDRGCERADSGELPYPSGPSGYRYRTRLPYPSSPFAFDGASSASASTTMTSRYSTPPHRIPPLPYPTTGTEDGGVRAD